MPGQFGELRELLQKPPSRRIFQQLIFLYPNGKLAEDELEYARGHLETWPSSIHRTLPRSWFREHRGEFPNGLLLCNHISLGNQQSGGHDFAAIDNQIIKALAAHDFLPSIHTLTFSNNSMGEQAGLDLAPLQYARGFTGLESIELRAHGLDHVEALFFNKHLDCLRSFKADVMEEEALAIAKYAPRSSWFHRLEHIEVRPWVLDFLVERSRHEEDCIRDFITWILEGDDFEQLTSLGIGTDALNNEALSRLTSTSTLFSRLERLALQRTIDPESDDLGDYEPLEILCSAQMDHLKELFLWGYDVSFEAASRIAEFLEQLSSLQLHYCSYEEDYDESALRDILRHPARLEHLVISYSRSHMPGYLVCCFEEPPEPRGICCTETMEYSHNGRGNYEELEALFQILDLDSCKNIVLDGNQCVFWMDEFSSMDAIPGRSVSFVGGDVGSEDWEHLIPVIPELRIEKINAQSNRLQGSLRDLLVSGTLSHVNELDLSENAIGSKCEVELFELYVAGVSRDENQPPKPSIRNLGLRRNDLAFYHLEFLRALLDFTAVEHVDLRFNNLDLKSPTSSCLSSFENLRSLDLSGMSSLIPSSCEVSALLDVLPYKLEFLDVSQSVTSLSDLLVLSRHRPMLDIKSDASLLTARGKSEISLEEQAEIDRWMRRRIFTEHPARLEVFPWSTDAFSVTSPGKTHSSEDRRPLGTAHTDPLMGRVFSDYTHELSSEDNRQEAASTWHEMMSFIPPAWQPVARRLEELGLPAPHDTGSEVMSGGLTTAIRCVFEWCRADSDQVIMLVDKTLLEDEHSYDARVIWVALSDADELETTMERLAAILSGRAL